jgi:hypothetical protein
MPQRRPSELVFIEDGAQSEKNRGGFERVARRFLPLCPAAMSIRLESPDARRAFSRRRLARLIDLRRTVS